MTRIAGPLCPLVVALAVACVPGAAASADEPKPVGSRTAPVTEASVDSKLAMLVRMTSPGGAGDAIERSADADARSRLERARATVARARAARAAAQMQEADALATEALAEFSVAVRRVQSPMQAAAQARRRYDELRARVTGFHEAHGRVVAEKSRTPVVDDGAVDAVLRQAHALAQDDRHAEAVALLAREADRLERALARLRDRETLVQELKFDSIEDEFRYERSRNRSYEMLVQMALDEQRVAPRNRDAAVAVIAGNHGARDRADAMATSGDPTGALALLEGSTGRLIATLRSAGFPIP